MTYLNNPIAFLFDQLEVQSGIEFISFTSGQAPKEDFHDQPYMKMYQDTQDQKLYKYIWDPNLAFDFRFHQRMASIKYSDRSQPWISIIFNTKEVRPLTNVISHIYTSQEITDTGYYPITTRRLSVPINLVFISNDLPYLYNFLEQISFFFNRLVNFKYNQAIKFSDTFTQNYELTAQALNITPEDLNKLDTTRRGSLATASYSLDLVYFAHSTNTNNDGGGGDGSDSGHLLKTIDLRILVVDDMSKLSMNIM